MIWRIDHDKRHSSQSSSKNIYEIARGRFTELRSLPAEIAHHLKLSRAQELLIRNVVAELLIEIANSADEAIGSFDELLGAFKPLSALAEGEILNMPNFEFRLRCEAAGETFSSELDEITHKVMNEPIDWAAIRAARERGH